MCDEELTVATQQVEEEECVCTPKKKQPKKKNTIVDELPCTCPYDPRFPNTNQTRRCFVNFYDYQKCVRLLGNYQGCRIFKICYETLCPIEWVNRWYEEIDKGTFPYIYPPKTENIQLPDEDEPFNTAGY